MNGTPFPSSTPMSSVDVQQLALINGIHNHVFSASQMFIMTIVMFSPLPMSWKLAVFNFLSSSPIAHLSPTAFLFVICAGPILSLLFLYFATKYLLSFAKHVLPLALSRFRGKPEDIKFLELTFPANNEKSAYATEQLYTLLHTLAQRNTGLLGSLVGEKRQYSLEIVSTKNEGIRYVLAADPKDLDILKRSLLSYLSGIKIREIEDYLNLKDDQSFGIAELKLSGHFALPLAKQNTLSVHDPIAYLTGHMTGLQKDELVAFQIVTTPVLSSVHTKVINEMKILKHKMYRSEPIAPVLQKSTIEQLSQTPVISALILLLKGIGKVFSFSLMLAASFPAAFVDSSGKSVPIFQPTTVKVNVQEILNPYEQELRSVVKEKIDQHLFEATIRILVAGSDEEDLEARMQGLISSFGPMGSAYQSLTSKSAFGRSPHKRRLEQFFTRTLSTNTGFNQNPILSTSEISDIFHFPYTDITKTEGLIKSKSENLPAPISMKRSSTRLDIILGQNIYGAETVPIGLTLEQRERHTYVIGKTGMGKTEMLKNMIYQDMVNGKGLAVLDPHGDLFHELLRLVPKNRMGDVVVFDPADKEFPVGLNILSAGIHFTDEEEGHDWITSTTLAVFKKLTDEKYWGPRLEHILRNATMTALETPSPSLFSIQKLLTKTHGYQKSVAANLKDPILKQFWESEFSLFGRMQQADVVSPITNKLGKFITSKMSRNILLQESSTINIQKIMDEGKIFLVNLSKGELGEDQSFFFGSLITSLIQLAAYQRIHVGENQRRDFFLYVDEFQNFATHIFEELSSEGRKWHVPLITSHQNIAQIRDTNILKIVAGNADSFIAMKAGPDDERFIIPFMAPEVEKGSIVNLPPHKFFMKVTSSESEDAFSGQTQLLDIKGNDKAASQVVSHSRKHYANPKAMVEKQLAQLFGMEKKKAVNKTDKTKDKSSKNIELKSTHESGKISQKHGLKS